MNFSELYLRLPWLEPIGSLISSHPYIIIFIGLLIGGETILLPALYLALTGSLNIVVVIIIMIVATIISDTLWYALGRGVVPHAISYFFKNKLEAQSHQLGKIVKGKELVILFFSKFVYGTRIAAQVVCGIYKVPFWWYVIVNSLAVVVLAFVYLSIIKVAIIFSYNLTSLTNKVFTFATILILSLALLHLLFKRIVKR